jgi:hypothetical protein
MNRNKIPFSKALSMIRTQLPSSYKERKADFVIDSTAKNYIIEDLLRIMIKKIMPR